MTLPSLVNLRDKANFVAAPALNKVTGSLATDSGFSTSLQMAPGLGSIATSGTWAGTLTVQLSSDNATWFDVESFTANFNRTINAGFKSYFRVGFKGSSHTSGTVNYMIAQGY
jgi:hypothetical protein